MRHVIPASNWHIALADAIEAAEPNDTIVVVNNAKLELGQSAARRLGRQDLTFVVEPTPTAFHSDPDSSDR